MNIQDRPVIILGAGGHAKVASEVLELSNHNFFGYITPDLDVGTKLNYGVVLGDDSIIDSYSINEIALVNGIGMLPKNNLRFNVSTMMRSKGYSFARVIHPSSILAADVLLEDGVQIMAGSIIQPGVRIGKDSIINTGVIIDHDCYIGENCHLAPGVICSGGVTIEKNVHIGTGSQIIQGVRIGENSVIAAGSVIYKDVPKNVLIKQNLKTEEIKF